MTTLPPGQCVEIFNLFYLYFTKKVTFNKRGGDGVSVSEPLVVKLVTSLEKAADILCVILENIPCGIWTSHLKEKALEALLKLHSEVCLPFLQAKYNKVSYCIGYACTL